MSAERIERALRPLVRPLARLRPDPANARVHDARNLEAIRASLREFGQQKPIVLARDGRTVIAGSGTLEAARSLGWTRIAAARSRLTPAQARAYGLADNRTGELATWNRKALEGVLQDLQRKDAELLSLLWSASELEKIITTVAHAAAGDADAEAVAPTPPKPRSRTGQVYALGPHRLICGDATDPAIVDRLFRSGEGQVAAELLWTDPPYGVDYQGHKKPRTPLAGDRPQDIAKLLDGLLAQAARVLAPGARYYLMCPEAAARPALERAGWRIHQTLIWVKDSIVISRADYHFRHETALTGCTCPHACTCPRYRERHAEIQYGSVPGAPVGRLGRGGRAGVRWYGGHSEGTVFEIPRPKRSDLHSTMKPVALIEAHLRNSTKPEDIVYDCCGGAGSTLIAAHRLGRRAYLVEKDRGYCDVIRSRYATYVQDPSLAP